jgi:hypothetical protein
VTAPQSRPHRLLLSPRMMLRKGFSAWTGAPCCQVQYCRVSDAHPRLATRSCNGSLQNLDSGLGLDRGLECGLDRGLECGLEHELISAFGARVHGSRILGSVLWLLKNNSKGNPLHKLALIITGSLQNLDSGLDHGLDHGLDCRLEHELISALAC